MTEDRKTTEELQRECFAALTWYFSERPTGFYAQLGQVKEQLTTLNERLEQSGKASLALTSSLNRLTFWGVIVASLGVLIAGGHLVLGIIKYCNDVAA
jgi:hypothetical protein